MGWMTINVGQSIGPDDVAYLLQSISAAAAFVNVMTRMPEGLTPCSSNRCILCVITVVFPDPGPARTIMGPSLWERAARCASLNSILHLSAFC